MDAAETDAGFVDREEIDMTRMLFPRGKIPIGC
jgi:hypothetical protein